MVLCFYFNEADLPFLSRSIAKLDDETLPNQWSDDESSKKIQVNPKQLEDLSELLKNNARGIFLHANKACFCITLRGGDSNIFVECDSDQIAENLFQKLSKCPVQYGYACGFDERKHRNQITSKKKYGSHEVWVGRTFETQLPGLYWLNAIPRIALGRYKISETDLKKVAKTIAVNENEIVIVKLYDSSENWSARASEIDNWCRETSGCFSKDEAQQQLDGAQNFMEASEVGRRWK